MQLKSFENQRSVSVHFGRNQSEQSGMWLALAHSEVAEVLV